MKEKKRLTPQALFEHRLGALLGKTIEQIRDLPQRELNRWIRYWQEEPWGSYRDNLHAAMMICNLLKPYVDKGSKLNIDDFMLKPAADLRAEKVARMARAFEDAAAPRKKPNVAVRRG